MMTPNFRLAFISGTFMMLLLISCTERKTPFYQISGPTMGTKYDITVQTNAVDQIKIATDSILEDFNLSMSLYIDSSTLINFNNADSIFCFDRKKDPYFEPIFNYSKEVNKKTNGAFDPSIAPLVNYYGFGYKEKKKLAKVDTSLIKDYLKLMVFKDLELKTDKNGMLCITKPSKDVKLDFNAISPGYVADVIHQYYVSKGIRNFMINVGGEIRTLGQNDRQQDWVIGINKPSENASTTEIELPLRITNKAMATSGNYRNAYDSKGQKFAHIINPFTGMSHPTDILSATVIADECMAADAYATTFMVLGLEKSLLLLEQLNGIEACFIYDKEGDGIFEFKISNGFSKYYLHNEQK
jgi:FAD:protein FMN transferase